MTNSGQSVDHSWPIWATFLSCFEKLGQHWANLDQHWSIRAAGPIWPIMTGIDQHWSTWANCWSTLVNADQHFSQIDQCWSKQGRTSASGAIVGQLLGNFSATFVRLRRSPGSLGVTFGDAWRATVQRNKIVSAILSRFRAAAVTSRARSRAF